MTTRSARLFAGTTTGKPSGVIYTAPSTAVVILKTIHGAMGATPNTLTLYTQDPSAAFAYFYTKKWVTGDPQLFLWSGWIVLEPGDQVVVSYDTGPVYYWGSGALLPVPT